MPRTHGPCCPQLRAPAPYRAQFAAARTLRALWGESQADACRLGHRLFPQSPRTQLNAIAMVSSTRKYPSWQRVMYDHWPGSDVHPAVHGEGVPTGMKIRLSSGPNVDGPASSTIASRQGGAAQLRSTVRRTRYTVTRDHCGRCGLGSSIPIKGSLRSVLISGSSGPGMKRKAGPARGVPGSSSPAEHQAASMWQTGPR